MFSTAEKVPSSVTVIIVITAFIIYLFYSILIFVAHCTSKSTLCSLPCVAFPGN